MTNPATPALDPFTAETIEARIRTFESFGIHRTGWEGDDQTSEWLAEQLSSAGVEAELERFTFPRVELQTARLSWSDGGSGREHVDGVPLFDGGFTDRGGIDGELVEDDSDDIFGNLVVATSLLRSGSPLAGREAYARLDELRDHGAVGVILPSSDPDGAVTVRNAERIDTPLGLPVLQVPSSAVRALTSAMLVGGEGVLEIDGDRLTSRASNVVATLPGSDPDAAPLGIMTPKSGWFTCAAERGGGIVIWLALAEALAAMPDRRRTVHLLASSGHELHHYGLQSYLRANRSLISGAVAWLHLGASIGAKVEPMRRMGASDEELHALATGAFDAAGIEGYEPFPAGDSGFGEARNIAEGGGRFVTILGGHAYFHSPNDTVDTAVDAESVARYARAALAIVEGMLAL